MLTTIQKYGLYYALTLVLGFYLSHLVLGTSPDNYTKGEIVGYSVMILSSITIYFATKAYRESTHDGKLSFWSGVKLGSGISVIGAFGFGLYNGIYIKWIHPEFIDEYIGYTEVQIRNSGLEQAVLEKQLAELDSYAQMMDSTLFYMFVMFATVLVIGFLFTLVTAAALKR